MLFQRGRVWWYEFSFLGQRVRESTHSRSKTQAVKAEREKRHQLENGVHQTKDATRAVSFAVAAKSHLEESEPHWSASNARIEQYNVDHLMPHFGKLLLVEITGVDVSRYQAARKKDGASPRTVNMEVGTLRAIMRKRRLWANIQPDIRMLKTKQDTGRALSEDEQHRLLIACKKSRSRSLYPAALLSLHSGLRNAELRLLRWRQIDLLHRTITVGKSKTAGGEGRIVPLSQTATRCLEEWRSQFPEAQPAHYVFPSERYGLDGEEGYLTGKAGRPYEIRPDTPIGSWKVSWTAARSVAKVSCRWHDMRHTFVSTMAEGEASDATIMSLAGHLSRKMMEKYSHTRNEAKRQAISALDKAPKAARRVKRGVGGSPQNHPQHGETETTISQ
jgi:integrase